MNTQQPMEDRLWDYIDGISSPAEKSAIEALIASNREWRAKYSELLNIHQLLNSSELEAPSMRFTKNVMEEISRYHVAPATKTYINKNIIRSIGAFFLTMILGVLGYCFGQLKWTGNSKDNAAFDRLLPNPGPFFEKFSWAKTFNSAWFIGFMMIAMVMGWMLLDMYLTQKKSQSRTQS
jgi:hypothetical protein